MQKPNLLMIKLDHEEKNSWFKCENIIPKPIIWEKYTFHQYILDARGIRFVWLQKVLSFLLFYI